ncbi:MAG: histidine phosphatase family protein [Pseudomonas sp.]|nr:histidine phosphatase family protein [Pseudomonas sp.]
MEYRLWLARTRRSVPFNHLAKHKTRLAALFCAGLVVTAAVALTRPATPMDLSKADTATIGNFNSHWVKGEMIVLVRHAERCDRSTTACLGPADGITERGKAVVQQVGLEFQKLGMERADIYNSPVIRAAQTSNAMFNYTSTTDQTWLSNCRKHMLRDALQHKVKNRNLVLVTHSECFSALEKSMDLAESRTRDYGTSLFLSVSDDGMTPKAVGFIDANDWQRVLGN